MTTEQNDPKRPEALSAPNANYLISSQFDESWDIVNIVRREIRKSGKFTDKLKHQSIAFSLGQKFDENRAELILRDQYQARFGETMKQTLDGILEREANLPETAQRDALDYARMVSPLIRDGETMPFYRAYDYVSSALAEKLNITETGAKKLMTKAFRDAEGRELFDVGKEMEKQFHQPVREAAQQVREAKRGQTRSRART